MDLVKVKCKLKLDSPDKGAILIIDSFGDPHWLPRSQIKIIDTDGDKITLKCPRWLAEKEELSYTSSLI